MIKTVVRKNVGWVLYQVVDGEDTFHEQSNSWIDIGTGITKPRIMLEFAYVGRPS